MIRALSLVLLCACAPKITATSPRALPEPLPSKAWVMPTSDEGTLSNGVRVVVVSNHEVPLWELRAVFDGGGRLDPAGQEGLSSVTFDMLNEGAGGKTAAQLARELEMLGGGVGASASRDGASVTASGPKKNLGAVLDLWADVLLRPDFPDADWKILQTARIADLKAESERPTSIADKVTRGLVWGDTYAGRTPTEASYTAMSTAQMRELYQRSVTPDRATILVGGDLTLAEVLPELEKRLAGWTTKGDPLPANKPEAKSQAAAKIFLIDKPGAAQSVLQAALPVATPGAPDHFALYMGNTVLGGAFTARINMNLREDKGYTYGARCGIELTLGPEIWGCSTSVNTPVTGPAFTELRKEVTEVLSSRPVTADELAFFRGFRVNAFQGAYELPGSLLDEITRIRLLGLPADWLERYQPGVEAVDPDAANAALQHWLQPDHIVWVVVGDKAKILGGLTATGLEITELDRQGNPKEHE
jgi:zinc protease